MNDSTPKKTPETKPITALVTGTTVLSVPREWRKDGVKNAVLTTYDCANPVQRRKVFAALNADCQGAADWINKVLVVQHVVMHPVAITDEETGESTTEVRTILIDLEGNCVAFVSRMVEQFFERLTVFGMPGPWDPPLKLLLRQKQFKGGRSGYTLTEQE